MSLHRAALALARKALPVHPCRPDEKVPILDDWPNRASTNPTLIDRWWGRWPEANIGIATGGRLRLLAVDVDVDAGGEAALAELEREHGALPATVEVTTPRGGRHLYFLVPDDRPMPGNSAGKLGPGIDTRGQGGYVLAPPSVVNGRAYCWSVDSCDRIGWAPAWLLDKLAQGGGDGRATPPEVWRKLVKGIEAGARNQAVTRLAGLLFRRLPDPLVAAQLVLAFNDARCCPPLPAEEVQRTLDSIAAMEMRRRGLSDE
jgi:Bifunctional DNA primase/polymerase, N-terminal/Primase C terminal 1 (PriCT-1)